MPSFEPFFFRDDRQLFGIYHPATGLKKGHSVVIAGPLLNEYMRSHLTLRQAAAQLAQSGYDVLRFDYAGTGNSLGNIDAVSIAQWCGNIAEATKEIDEITGNSQTSILAVRFAANLAADFAQALPVRRFLMWDPVFSGDAWFESLRRSRAQLLKKHSASIIDESREYGGQRLSHSFLAELHLRSAPEIRTNNGFAVITDSFEQIDFLAASGVKYRKIEFSCGWTKLTSQVLYGHEVVEILCQAMN